MLTRSDAHPLPACLLSFLSLYLNRHSPFWLGSPCRSFYLKNFATSHQSPFAIPQELQHSPSRQRAEG